MGNRFRQLFQSSFPIIGCVHLLPLPGSPRYQGDLNTIFDRALKDADLLLAGGCHGLIIENFGDAPFYPDQVEAITISTMSAITQRIRQLTHLPIGINVLRNDAEAALSIAMANNAQFIRVNIHMHAFVADQGIITGQSYRTLRLRSHLQSNVSIWADIMVKHADPLVNPIHKQWVEDLENRGLADALIVSGTGTGQTTDPKKVQDVRDHANGPVLLGSGLSPENINLYTTLADGAIVGSYFKENGSVQNPVDVHRVRKLIQSLPK